MYDRVPTQWPKNLPAKIAFVAEAPGDSELLRGIPLIGRSGKVFNKALHDAGISRDECLVTNVFDYQLPDNKIDNVAVPRADYSGSRPPVSRGGYLLDSVSSDALARLKDELTRSGANVIVALGGVAMWALFDYPGDAPIKRIRGAVRMASLVPIKVIPTYHPAFLLHNGGKNFNKYPLLWADFLKAKRESQYPELRKFERELYVPQTIDRARDLFERLSPPVAVDIETKRGLIDCIGFSDGYITFTIPVFNDKTFKPYWARDDEVDARFLAYDFLTRPIPKIFQNGSYDVQVLWETWGVRCKGYVHDTRLLHHALWPELPKDLGTMAALHTDLPAWKPIKGKGLKKDE